MTKVALIDKAPTRTDYVAHFKNEFEFDQYHLCSEQKKKILKRDVDIEIDLDEYDWIILVGSEALQNFTRENQSQSIVGNFWTINISQLSILLCSLLNLKQEGPGTNL